MATFTAEYYDEFYDDQEPRNPELSPAPPIGVVNSGKRPGVDNVDVELQSKLLKK